MAFNRTGNSDTQTPVVTNGGYSAGDVVGGLLTFAVGGQNDGGNVARLLLRDADGNGAAFTAYIFNAEPTAIADNEAFALSVADFGKLVGTVDIDASNYLLSNTLADSGNVAVPYKTADGNLYVYLVGAPTFTGTDKLNVKLSVWKD